MLESRGSKGSVQVNGKTIKRGSSCILTSGDEVVFGSLGSNAYVSFCFSVALQSILSFCKSGFFQSLLYVCHLARRYALHVGIKVGKLALFLVFSV